MQYDFSCLPDTLDAVEATLSPARLSQFLEAAGGDRQMALRYKLWNMQICEAFYTPLQFTEVALRNAVQRAVQARFGDAWHEAAGFSDILPDRLKQELDRVVRDRRKANPHDFRADHVVSGLTLGFVLNLFSKRYRNIVWQRRTNISFPNAYGIDLSEIRDRVNRFRLFRNKIMHHYAVFDRGPSAEYGNMLTLVGYVCEDTQWLLKQVARVNTVINRRPPRF